MKKPSQRKRLNFCETSRVYPNISNALWEEDTISWATGCNFTTSENYGTTMSFGSWTCFDITNLAKARIIIKIQHR